MRVWVHDCETSRCTKFITKHDMMHDSITALHAILWPSSDSEIPFAQTTHFVYSAASVGWQHGTIWCWVGCLPHTNQCSCMHSKHTNYYTLLSNYIMHNVVHDKSRDAIK